MVEGVEANVEALVQVQQDHERRITQLETNEIQTKNALLKIENTIITQNTTTHELLRKVVDHHFEDKKSARQSSDKRWEKVTAAIGGLLGAGSAVYLIIDKLF